MLAYLFAVLLASIAQLSAGASVGEHFGIRDTRAVPEGFCTYDGKCQHEAERVADGDVKCRSGEPTFFSTNIATDITYAYCPEGCSEEKKKACKTLVCEHNIKYCSSYEVGQGAACLRALANCESPVAMPEKFCNIGSLHIPEDIGKARSDKIRKLSQCAMFVYGDGMCAIDGATYTKYEDELKASSPSTWDQVLTIGKFCSLFGYGKRSTGGMKPHCPLGI